MVPWPRWMRGFWIGGVRSGDLCDLIGRVRAPNSARIGGVQVPTQATGTSPGIQAQLRFRENPWRAGGGERMARRRTNVIRRDGSASKRARASLPRRNLIGVSRSTPRPNGWPVKGGGGSMAWLTMGHREDACRGLGTPAGIRAPSWEPSGIRGVIVPRNPAKAGGWEGRQGSECRCRGMP